ncbi:hypothetical protein NLI96_g12362 [Meripilus lineatus]|uniref:Uncharacterized protein n=1 Tax=Meripilus lineatus TaxID=2056292 RepID=A0AAD5Y894_9APHY|nr:hypothetical protein NLI96_g12362 [Physisporinus lineatus]
MSLVQSWLKFERSGYQSKSDHLPEKKRPRPFKEWFESGRKDLPNINAQFGRALLAWWDQLQPKARRTTKGTPLADIPQKEWESLRIPGKQGIYLILIGIAWWGVSLTKRNTVPESSPEWKGMVDDVQSVLGCWASQPAITNTESQKRKKGSTSEGASKRRRRK